MKIAILCIGDELLKGATINTNMAFLGEQLTRIGIIPERAMVVADRREELHAGLETLLPEADIVITTGGLGPTADDMTMTSVAEFTGRKLVKNIEVETAIFKRWMKLKRGNPPERVMVQAMVPEGVEILPNRVGTAPGIWLEMDGGKYESKKIIAMLPGPPIEITPMTIDFVIPRIKGLLKGQVYTDLMYTVGIPESILEDEIQPIIKDVKNLSVAYCASPGGVRLFLSSPDEALLNLKSRECREFLKGRILPDGCETLAEEVSLLLRERGEQIATAESCTGGMIAAEITRLSGSSDIFPGSMVTYSNEVKIEMLGVPKQIIAEHGAVSRECAGAMVEKICEKFSAAAGIAVSGIAGPSGGTKEKPVGLVYIGVKYRDKQAVTENNFSGNREMVRLRAMNTAFNLLRKMLLGKLETD